MTHKCVGKLTIIGSDNGLSHGRRQAIIWTNAGILLFGNLGSNFSEILLEFDTFSSKKMHLKMSVWKMAAICLSLNVLISAHYQGAILSSIIPTWLKLNWNTVLLCSNPNCIKAITINFAHVTTAQLLWDASILYEIMFAPCTLCSAFGLYYWSMKKIIGAHELGFQAPLARWCFLKWQDISGTSISCNASVYEICVIWQ